MDRRERNSEAKTIQTLNFLIMDYPESSCRFLYLLSKYSSQYPVLVHLECTFSFYGKKPK